MQAVKKVQILIEADLMEGEAVERITKADVLCCENTKVIYAVNKMNIVKTKAEAIKYVFGALYNHTGFTKAEICSKFRKRDLVYCRAAICNYLYEIRNLKGFRIYSLKEIGRILGDRDHTTVLHSIKIHRDMTQIKNDEYALINIL